MPRKSRQGSFTKKAKRTNAVHRSGERPALSEQQQQIRHWYLKTKFRKRLFGGVDEADVWKKLSELNALYEAALSAERIRYDALLASQGEANPTMNRLYRSALSNMGISASEEANDGK